MPKIVEARGKQIVNDSLIDHKSEREAIDIYYVPANEIAMGLGNARATSMVMLGAYIEAKRVVRMSFVIETFTGSQY